MNIRLIAKLDIKGPNLVKGIRMEGLRVLGSPARFARAYYEAGIDELFFVDSVASLYGRNSLVSIIERTAKEIFVPLAVGGGLRTVEDMRDVLRAGADKVSINTAALSDPSLIQKAARRFGSSTIILSIPVMKSPETNNHVVYTEYGRQCSGVDAVAWAVQGVERGAGEILVTSVEREGTGRGFDLEIIKKIADAVPVPVIASGGAGRLAHTREAVTEGNADAVCLASMLHYGVFRDFDPFEPGAEKEGNAVLMANRAVPAFIAPERVGAIKHAWIDAGLSTRPGGAA